MRKIGLLIIDYNQAEIYQIHSTEDNKNLRNYESGYHQKFTGLKKTITWDGHRLANHKSYYKQLSKILSQFDEITTSHNGFLTMAVEYGLLITLLILFFIIYLILKNYNKENEIEVALLFMLLTQNLTNDLIYAPDVAIYFWIIPFYFLANILKD